MRNYSSYLVRHWLMNGSGEQRQVLDLQHIQTGRRTRVSTLVEAQKWLELVSRQDSLVEENACDRECLYQETDP
jgi:hypothetical protein